MISPLNKQTSLMAAPRLATTQEEKKSKSHLQTA
jgi:hypothetical protein